MSKPINALGKRQNRSVSLYAHQREAFNKLGGSKWLQLQIERAIEDKVGIRMRRAPVVTKKNQREIA